MTSLISSITSILRLFLIFLYLSLIFLAEILGLLDDGFGLLTIGTASLPFIFANFSAFLRLISSYFSLIFLAVFGSETLDPGGGTETGILPLP